MVSVGVDMTSDDAPEPHESAIETAKKLRDDLEAIAASDLPFAYDAEQILDALDQADDEGRANQ